MKKHSKIFWSILLGLSATVVIGAAGDRFISNPTQDKDLYLQVNDGGTPVNVVKAVGATSQVQALVSTDGTCGIGNICSGVYTPVLTNIGNVSSSLLGGIGYMRVGNVVTVAGMYDMNTTSGGGAATEWYLTLPIASNCTNIRDGGGSVQGGIAGSPTDSEIASCYCDPGTDKLYCAMRAYSTTNRSLSVHFTYIVK